MMQFVTLFNLNYLSRGLTLHRSLLDTGADFHLYVIAFDDYTYNYLHKNTPERLTVISLSEFEDQELIKIRAQRSAAEYCWTCTPSAVLYCIERFKLDHCVYIDADLYFYTDPSILFKEWGTRSVLITRHRYTKQYDQSDWNGIYCVQFVGFRNNEQGKKALKWWRNACLDWCYARAEDGKFGDQKYLDDWPVRFEGVCDLEYLGGGVAPWNVQQYELELKKNKWTGKEKNSGKEFELVFFHFHGLKFYEENIVGYSGEYDLSGKHVNNVYKDYVSKLISEGKSVLKEHPGVNVHGVNGKSPFLPLGSGERLRKFISDLSGKVVQYGELHKNLRYL